MSDNAIFGAVTRIKHTADDTVIEVRVPREHFGSAVSILDSRSVLVVPVAAEGPYGPVSSPLAE